MILGIRKTAWDNATDDQRTVFRIYARRVDLGVPALYETGGGVPWYVFDDIRLSLKDAARFAVILRLIAQFDVIPDDLSRAEIREAIKAWVDNHGGFVLPAIPEGEDPYGYTYAQNNGPAAGAARSSVPAGLTPVEA
jgi:hypothetical protein